MARFKVFQYQPEEQESVMLHNWLALEGLRHSHIPNETWTPSQKQKRLNREMGVSSGIPDYVILVPPDRSKVDDCPDGFIMWIELKRPEKSKSCLSANQKDWIEAINQVGGTQAFVAYGFDHAKQIISEYVKTRTQTEAA